MSTQVIGHVKSPKGKDYEVKWDPSSGEVYVAYAGWSKCREKAQSASHAADIAEVWLRDK